MVRKKQNHSSPLLHALDSKTDNIVRINEVCSKHTHLVCPSEHCRWPLTPVIKTTKKIQHFRHKPDSSGNKRECKDPVGALESAVHLLAKEAILKRKNLYLFPYSNTFDRYRGKLISPIVIGRFSKKGSRANLTDIESEVRRTAKDYQPDITALFDNEEFIIEIHYSHLVDQEKLEKIIRDDIPAIEISLSHIKDDELSVYEIDRAVVNPDNFKWLHYPKRWITDDELSDIDNHLAAEKQHIDDEIEYQKNIAEQEERERAKQQEQFEREQIRAEALRKEYFLAEYIHEYFVYLLEDKEISPFSDNERDELKIILRHVDRASEMITHHAGNADRMFHNIPNREEYNRVIKDIGKDHRRLVAKKALEIITKRDEWVSKHLVTLHELGWDNSASLRSLLNYKDIENIRLNDIQFDPIKIYIYNKLLPACKAVLEKHIEGFKV